MFPMFCMQWALSAKTGSWNMCDLRRADGITDCGEQLNSELKLLPYTDLVSLLCFVMYCSSLAL